jgi:hypothetical protein
MLQHIPHSHSIPASWLQVGIFQAALLHGKLLLAHQSSSMSIGLNALYLPSRPLLTKRVQKGARTTANIEQAPARWLQPPN